MKNYIPRVAFIFLAVIFFAGCGGTAAVKTSPEDIMASSKKADKLNEALIMSAITQQTPLEESYLIGPEDLLDIEAYNVEELKKTVRVNSHGDIALPLVGILKVKGLTTAEAEQLIAKKLDKFVQETVVTVFVKEYKSQRISVLGAVKKAQVFAITGQRYLLDMLLMADGLAAEAGSICYVIRPTLKTNTNSRAETIVINLDELIMRGNFSLNIPVFAGDIINVPKGGIFFVDGEVKTPGVYTMKGKTSLVQAITMAQGFGLNASTDDVRIFRDNGKGEREIIVVNYDNITSGSQPDMMIAENDIIIVAASGTKTFFNNFVRTIRGAVSFGGASMGF
ncbi:MAG: polysaccharide biosynthesis/export family protein [Nitrospirae bacterium]|nr:polysaccharide biosynthesis/export family protein [Nitrospirota bacterium]